MTHFSNSSDSSRDLNIFISFNFSFDITSVVVSDPKIFLWISASATDAVNFSGIGTLLINDWSIFFVNGEPNFSNGPRSLQGIILALFISFVII